MKQINIPIPVFSPNDAAAAVVEEVEADAVKDDGQDKAANEDQKTATALDLVEDDKPIATPVDWPDDWRDKIAGDDASALKRLGRFKAPGDIFKSFLAAEAKIKSGKDPIPAPDGEKDPEALKEWRADNGIPDDPSGYELSEDVQKLLTDDDKPVLQNFTEFAHGKNLPPAFVEAGAAWYVAEQERVFTARAEADKEQAQDAQDELRQEYGQEFRANTTMAKRFAEEITPGVNWFEARLDDGRKLGNIPDFVRALAKLGSQEYGDVAFAGGEAAKATADRKAEIEKIMREDMKAYDNDPAIKKEYFDILQAEEKRAPKA
jgi:hypothetical protein